MTSRERILAKVWAGVGGTLSREARRRIVDARLGAPRRHLIPARVAGKGTDELVGIMRRWLEAASGQLEEVAHERALPKAIAARLGADGLQPRVRIGSDPWLASLPWGSAPGLAVEHGAAQGGDKASATHALAAVAETGTVVVASGPANPVTLSFLPEVNFVAVRREDVVGSLEEAFARVRAMTRNVGMPRTVNLVSGPSRSADIGGIPVLGAHGPRRLVVLVVGGGS
jgi:L-lactate dehydrogenase complex protein LldG